MILLDPGPLPEKFIKKLVSNSKKELALITKLKETIPNFKNVGLSCYYYRDFNQTISESTGEDILKIYEEIINDIDSFHILDRRFLPRSILQNTTYILNLVVNFVPFIKLQNFDRFISLSTPHSVEHWVFARCFEILTSKKAEYFNRSFLPWRTSLMRGCYKREIIELDENLKMQIDGRLWKECKKIKNLENNQAMPKYERDRLAEPNLIKPFKFILNNFRRPDKILNTFLCHLAFKKICINKPNSKYVVMYLHYQPERTTSPDGGVFANQLLAASLIKKSIPDDTKLIVREHPSTFSRGADWKCRWPSFYSDFKKIGAEFVNFDTDPYSLLDNSLCVIAIGGNIISEAIFRGKPAIYFGVGTSYPIDHGPLHKFKSLSSLREFISHCETFNANDFKNLEFELREFIDKYTISAEIESDFEIDDLFTHSYNFKAIMKYLELELL